MEERHVYNIIDKYHLSSSINSKLGIYWMINRKWNVISYLSNKYAVYNAESKKVFGIKLGIPVV